MGAGASTLHGAGLAQYVELLSSLDDVQLAALDEAKLQEMGVMAADDVMQRIFYLTQIEPGSDY